ncbi:hypothetical protein T07_13252 [Trichinella nelsoni]|uniref:Uncharacterized protein n=1 Tax=Trichinella nelsoni TaxID=6336 RepID=A0A0V0RIC5_9BILA|nr:hypothetical protein T07_13252 [Trichinella nelsoni]
MRCLTEKALAMIDCSKASVNHASVWNSSNTSRLMKKSSHSKPPHHRKDSAKQTEERATENCERFKKGWSGCLPRLHHCRRQLVRLSAVVVDLSSTYVCTHPVCKERKNLGGRVGNCKSAQQIHGPHRFGGHVVSTEVENGTEEYFFGQSTSQY